MPKFCSDCGAKLLDENAKFCASCGAPQTRTEPQKVVKKYNRGGIVVGFITIFIGLIAIFTLYASPIYNILGNRYSIAEIQSLCSNPAINYIGGSVCSENAFFFNIGWIFALFMILGGIYEIYYAMKQ